MVPEGWILLDTPEALDQFRRDHYLYVYTTALELTGSPAEAHRLAAQVFLNIARRYANKAISSNCDMYLAAQVNLLYAQGHSQISPDDAAAAPAAPRASDTGTTARPQQSPTEVADRNGNNVASLPTQVPSMDETDVSEGMTAHSVTGSAHEKAAEVESASAPYSPVSTASVSTFADTPSVSTQATSRVYVEPKLSSMPTKTPIAVAVDAAVQIPAETASEAMPVVQEPQAYAPPSASAVQSYTVPMAAASPAMAATPTPAQTTVTIVVSTNPANSAVPVGGVPVMYAMAPESYPAAVQPTPTTVSPSTKSASGDTSLSPPIPAKPEEAASPSSGVTEVIYNPANTEFWSPDSEGKPVASASATPTEPEPSSIWEEEEPQDKPSMFLSIVNSVLTLAGIASFVYLLYRINLILNLF